jgi:hypothetical protein
MYKNIFILCIISIVASGYTFSGATDYTGYFQIEIEQDSTSPRKGTVKVNEISTGKKKKREKKKKELTEEEIELNKTKAWIKMKSEEEKALRNKERLASRAKNNKSKKENSKLLSPEEELRILSKTVYTEGKKKIHPEDINSCKYSFDVTDEFTGIRKTGLFARHFFSYTPKEYRKFIKEGDFIRCEGFLSKSSKGSMALNINLYISSKEARYKFGDIKKRSPMIIYTMDNKEFILMTYQGAEAKIIGENTVYQCSFAINKSDVKKLRKSETDRIKLRFEEGFQSFDVYYLDFLIDQFPCFD